MQILEQFRRNPVSEAHVLAAGWAQGDTSRKLIDNAKAIAARRRVDPDIVVLVEVAGAARCTLCNLMKVIGDGTRPRDVCGAAERRRATALRSPCRMKGCISLS